MVQVFCIMADKRIDISKCDGTFNGVTCTHYNRCLENAGITIPKRTIKNAHRVNTVFHGDYKDVLKKIPKDSIDLIVTSPPYGLDMGYDNSDDALKIFDLAKPFARVVKDGGRVCLNVPLDVNKGGHVPITAHYTKQFLDACWLYRGTIIWNERNISRRTAWGSWQSPSNPNFITPVEAIIVFSKNSYKHTGEKSDIDITKEEFLEWTLGLWTFSGESAKKRGHPAPFPEELPYRCIRLFSFVGDVVLDPFVGSGTTVLVAKKLGRKYIGVDTSQKYCAMTRKRLKEVL